MRGLEWGNSRDVPGDTTSISETRRLLWRAGGWVVLLFWTIQLIEIVLVGFAEGRQIAVRLLEPRAIIIGAGLALSVPIVEVAARSAGMSFGRRLVATAAVALAMCGALMAVNYEVYSIDLPGGRLPFNLVEFIYTAIGWSWFFLGLTGAVIGLAYSVEVRDRERRLSAMSEIARDARLAALRYQLNPHFLLMPELDGFDVVEALAKGGGDPPLVAFVTAYRKFAPQAFETGAIDFLPKPVRLGRLDGTLARARAAIEGREASRRLVELEGMLAQLRANHVPARDEHVWVPRRGEVVRVDLDRIERVEAEGAYVRLHLDGCSYLHREPIGAIEQRLDRLRFVRAHRSHIVRVDQVSSIRRTIHGGGELLLRDGGRVALGRKYSREARRRLLNGADEANDGPARPTRTPGGKP